VKNLEYFFDNLEKGINKALEHFEKWLLPWLHLPLVVCCLGGDNARPFASSFHHVVLKKPWIKPPMNLELQFAEELEDDLKNGITDDFGLCELLLNNMVRCKKICTHKKLLVKKIFIKENFFYFI
jgi:hypothetical protein